MVSGEEHLMRRSSLASVVIVVVLSLLVSSAHGQARSGSQAEVVASAFSAEVTGTVKSVNDKSGKLVVETAEGQVNVKLPPDAVQGIKEGDPVTISVGLVKPPPSASPTSPRTK
jgi:ferric-dicitrate binding protein FerR (iron transport regulator)